MELCKHEFCNPEADPLCLITTLEEGQLYRGINEVGSDMQRKKNSWRRKKWKKYRGRRRVLKKNTHTHTEGRGKLKGHAVC